mmetsp:Transcript_29969/g.86216  ORF Transcript_29969/g.86216 Transcript_29969/m.86216 type:complete len:212 (-) Transcript_29969:381-1016(-)
MDALTRVHPHRLGTGGDLPQLLHHALHRRTAPCRGACHLEVDGREPGHCRSRRSAELCHPPRSTLGDLRLRDDVLQRHCGAWDEGRLLRAASAGAERDNALRLEELEALAEVVDLIALSACGANNLAQALVHTVPDEDGVDDGPYAVRGLQRGISRAARVALPIREDEHTKIDAGVFPEAFLQHCDGLDDGRVDGGCAPLLHVIDYGLEAV